MKKIRVILIKNTLKEYLTRYAAAQHIKYSQAVKTLAEAVARNHRHIYSIASGRSQASGELQFAIAKFFGVRVEDIFLPVLSEKDEQQLFTAENSGKKE